MPNAAACSTWQLYVILDRTAAGSRDLAELAQAAIRGGADVLQLRDKGATAAQLLAEAQRLLPIAQAAGIPLIINDAIGVAARIKAAGVHLGQEDRSIKEARAALGPGALVGKSTHNLEQAQAAAQEGADYIGVGPIFPTPTKPAYGSVGLSLIAQVAAEVVLPKVCIGGIDTGSIGDVLGAGGHCVAVVRAVCAADNPEAAARQLKQRISDFTRRRSHV